MKKATAENIAKVTRLASHALQGLIVAAAAVLTPSFAPADEMLRPLAREEYGAPSNSTTDLRELQYLPVTGSRVAWANYEALKRDFPQLAQFSEADIDAWIIRNYAVVSLTQLDLEDLRYRNLLPSSQRASRTQNRTFLVPPSYGRAAVGVEQNPIKAGQPALIDLKGTGHTNSSTVAEQRRHFEQANALQEPARTLALDKLRTHDHSDGLMTLGEAVAEVSRQSAVQASFDLVNAKERSAFQTVESYFIISLPMQILKTGEHADPAAIYGRQAHFGRATKALRLPEEPTYTDDFGGKQNSRLGSAIDFGGVVIVQPDLQKTFGDPSLLQASQASRADAQLSNAWTYGHDAASAYLEHADHDERLARSVLNNHFATMLSPVRAQLAALSPKSRDVRLAEYLGHRDFGTAFVLDSRIHNRGGQEIRRLLNLWTRPAMTHSSEADSDLKSDSDHSRLNVLRALLQSFRPAAVRGFIATAFKDPNFEANRGAQAHLLIETAKLYASMDRAAQIDSLIALFPSNTSVSPYPIVKIMVEDSNSPQLRSLTLFFRMTETEQADIAKQMIAGKNVTALNVLKLELIKRRNLGKPLLEAILSTTSESGNELRLLAQAAFDKREPKFCLNVFGAFK